MGIEQGVMDAETVAGLLGVSTRQLNNYINMRDLPSQGSGRRRTFVWPEVLDWYVRYRVEMEMGDGNGGSEEAETEAETSDSGGRKEDIRAANLRKTRAEADLKQMALAKLRGEMIGTAEARVVVNRVFGNLRTQLLNMAPKLSTRLMGVPDPDAAQGIIREEMETLCRELATGQIVGGAAAEDETVDLTANADPDPLLEREIRDLNERVEAYARIEP